MTFCIKTFIITTFSRTIKYITRHNRLDAQCCYADAEWCIFYCCAECHYAECHYVECRGALTMRSSTTFCFFALFASHSKQWFRVFWSKTIWPTQYLVDLFVQRHKVDSRLSTRLFVCRPNVFRSNVLRAKIRVQPKEEHFSKLKFTFWAELGQYDRVVCRWKAFLA